MAIVDRGQVLAQGRVADIERRLRFGAVLRVRLLLEGEALEAARATVRRGRRTSPAPSCSTTARSSSGSAATTPRAAACSPSRSRPGLPIVSFARAASDLEELFLQVTSPDREPLEAA